MGLLDSIINTAIRRTVNKAVDHAVDQAFDSLTNQNNHPVPAQQVQQQPTICTVFKPNLTGKTVTTDGFSVFANKEIKYVYELPERLFKANSGAAEIAVCYDVASSEDEFMQLSGGLDSKLPEIYIDYSGEFGRYVKKAQDVVVSKVENHALIEEKYEYNNISAANKLMHNISYKFFLTPADREKNCMAVLTLTYSDRMNQELCSYAIQAFNYIASTLRIE